MHDNLEGKYRGRIADNYRAHLAKEVARAPGSVIPLSPEQKPAAAADPAAEWAALEQLAISAGSPNPAARASSADSSRGTASPATPLVSGLQDTQSKGRHEVVEAAPASAAMNAAIRSVHASSPSTESTSSNGLLQVPALHADVTDATPTTTVAATSTTAATSASTGPKKMVFRSNRPVRGPWSLRRGRSNMKPQRRYPWLRLSGAGRIRVRGNHTYIAVAIDV